jgi:PEP-CTERM motif
LTLACGVIAVVMILAIAARNRADQLNAAAFEPDDATDAASDDADMDTPVDTAVGRPVYRYSVIPGGAYDARELAQAIDRDPVVAAAYGGGAAAGVHSEIVAADKLAYMSYRIGEQIYWTKHRIRLRRGETILTNGSIELRGRCGNAISLDPMLPTAESEPAPLELEGLVVPESRALPSNPFNLAYVTQNGIPLTFGLGVGGESGLSVPPSGLGGGSLSPLTPGGATGTPPQDLEPPLTDVGTPGTTAPPPDTPHFDVVPGPPGSSGSGGVPTVLVTIPGGLGSSTVPDLNGGGGGGSTPPVSTPEGPAAPVPTPEPGTFLLIGGGLISVVARKLRSRG